MNVGIYVRVSTKKAGQEHGLEAQRRACLKLIQEKGLGEGTVLFKDQISGRQAERPGLRKLLQAAAMKQIRAVVLFRLDRLTRGGIAEMFRVVKTLEDYGVRVYSVSESWFDPDNPTHDLTLAILAWAAAFESQAIAERVAAGIAATKAERMARGEPWIWGGAHRSKLTKDPTLPAKALQMRREGLSWSQIAKRLDVGRTTARTLCGLAQAQQGAIPKGREVVNGGPTE